MTTRKPKKRLSGKTLADVASKYTKLEPLKVRHTITGSDGVERVVHEHRAECNIHPNIPNAEAQYAHNKAYNEGVRLRPIPTVNQIEEAVAGVTAGIYAPVSTRTPYDLVIAVCGLAVFFMVTHALAGWPI